MKECERVRLKMNVLKTQYMTTREGGEMKKIPVQVPAIKICFMSIDEIARIFFQSYSLYRERVWESLYRDLKGARNSFKSL